ncbi:MAG: putative FAD-linked oxidoreductase [Syntrophorhabdus sp. PtaU1.Bin153]|nr:MAG: putative FAD-linked oxidoreductase [Syntrophorhabdus sp. PtaU1.Bin153]
MIPEEVGKTAAQCRHYAMCKIDFLGTGLCPSGRVKHYVSYYPQGRMDICDGLARGLIPVTEGLVDIVGTCTLCGICDKQCHFVTGLRPLKVMRSLKEFIAAYIAAGQEVKIVDSDPVLESLREIVGHEWASNDPAILLTYSNDPFPLADMQMPRYVVLPRTGDQIVRLVHLANGRGIPYVVRGNGGSVFGFVFTDGIVIDVNRMKSIDIDRDNWVAVVEPGVTSFELQQEVAKLGFRVNAAEPAATVCGNIVCTGMFSTWSNAYGVGADNFVNMEFVDRQGGLFHLNEKTAPNIFAFTNEGSPSPGICTKAYVRMHPAIDDEEGLLVPFSSFSGAVSFARDLSRRRIGSAIGVLGGHYLSTFISPSAELAERVRSCLTEALGIEYAVFIVADRYARETIKGMAGTIIDNRLFRMLMLGLPHLNEDGWLDLIRDLENEEQPYEILLREEMYPVIETVLSPSPETLAQAVDHDLKDFYSSLYARPEMTDLLWLNAFRIVSSRMARHKHVFVFVAYVPLARLDIIEHIAAELKAIADRYAISNDFGFLTPLDLGKRAILEYDYYIDHTDRSEGVKIGKALGEVEPMFDRLSATTKGVRWLKYVFGQGSSRKESFLYT